MELVVLAPSTAVKQSIPRPRDAAGEGSSYRGRKQRGRRVVVGRLGSLVVLASLALAFVAVALTTLKA